MKPQFKANDFVRIIKPAHLVVEGGNQLVPDDSVVGMIGIVRATFNYDTQAPDYDIAIVGRKYKSHHQHLAIDECFIEQYISVSVNTQAA